jgi:lysophospholipase L1-like esterase
VLNRLKQRIIALAAAAVTAFSSAAVFAETLPDFNVEVNAPPKIVFLGDSIAAGYGLDGYSADDNTECASYANILSMIFESELPEQAEFSSENLAVDGLTSTKLLRNLQDGLYDKALGGADAVVVSIGGNDLLWVLLHILDSDNSFSETIQQLMNIGDTLDENLERFGENLPKITEEIQSRSGGTRLFLQTLYNPFEGSAITALDELAQDKIGRLNELISEEADGGEYSSATEIADIAAAFSGRNAELTNIGELDIHPNADGHAQIAKTLQPLIEAQTYTYYDYEAERKWNESQTADLQDKSENSDGTKLALFAGSAAAALIALTLIIILNHNRNKERK